MSRDLGKKIDYLEIKTPVRTHRVDLRFNRDSGYFSAAIGEVTVSNKDLETLKKDLREACIAHDNVSYERYIQVVFKIRRQDTRRSFSDLNDYKEGERNRGLDDPVSGLSLMYRVVDVSGPLPRKKHESEWGSPMRLFYTLEETPSGAFILPEGPPNRWTGGMDDLVPFTPRRLEILRRARAGLEALATCLAEVFHEEDGAKLAANIDGTSPSSLALMAQKMVEEPAKPAPKKAATK